MLNGEGTGLSNGTTYYIAIKTADEVPNWSGVSDNAVGTTNYSGTSSTFHPSGANGSDGATYVSSAATDLDTNDTTYYGTSSGSSNDYWLDIDDHTTESGAISSVQVSARVRCTSTCDGGWGNDDPADFDIGVKTNGSTYYDGGHTHNTTSYSLYNGTSYATNPQSGSAWTWGEIDALIGIVNHNSTSSTASMRVTELYVTVNYTPADTTAPSAVTLATGTLTDTSIQLTWTAPGDDAGSGTASTYDIRYSTSAITAGNWGSATQVSGEPAPQAASSSESFTVTGLDPNTTYYFAIKTADEVPNWSAISNSPSATTLERPVGGYTADDVIPAAQISQATDGSGDITINWKGRDNQTQNVTLNTFEYSTDGGASWNAPTNGDASGSLSTNWDDNGGSGWTTATTFGAATAHSFTFNTKHADVSGIDGTDQSDIQVRFTLNDGGIDSANPATSEDFQVDDLAPTSTITSAVYDAANDKLTITGTDFLTIAAATTDIKSYVDWTKFVWDINGDNATTANITFVEGDVTSLVVTDDTTLTLQFTGSKGTAIEATSDYSTTGGADTLDVTAGFIKDYYGNAATTDGAADATLVTTQVSGTVYFDDRTSPMDPGKTIRLLVDGTSVGTGTTDGSGDYTIWANVAAGDAVLAYIDGDATYFGVTVSITDNASLTGFDIYADHVTTRHDNGGSLSNADMDTAKGAYSDSDILYAVSGGALTVSGSATNLYIPAGQTFVPGGDVTTPTLEVAGTFTGGSGAIDVDGDLDFTGSFTATSGTTNVGGDFINNGGTFTASGGSVILDGTNQYVYGSSTFYDFTKSVASADTLTFEAGETTTIASSGTVTLNGASGQLLSLVSDTPGSYWNFVVSSGATKAIDYVDVSDSDASGSDASQKPIDPANYTDSDHNVDWFRAPIITVTKLSVVISDPISGGTNPKRIPGAVIEYSVSPSNSGDGSPDANSTYITDVIDTSSLEYDATTGVTFTDGTTSSALSLDTVTFSDDAAPGPYTYDYTPVPDGNGYDAAVTSIKVTTTGTFAYGGSPDPSFTIKYRVRTK